MAGNAFAILSEISGSFTTHQMAPQVYYYQYYSYRCLYQHQLQLACCYPQESVIHLFYCCSYCCPLYQLVTNVIAASAFAIPSEISKSFTTPQMAPYVYYYQQSSLPVYTQQLLLRLVASQLASASQLLARMAKFLSNLLASIACFTGQLLFCLLYTSPSPRDQRGSRMPSSA